MGNHETKSKSYENYFTSRLKSGDIVLFCGSGIFSMAVQLSTLSRWSHIGLVIKLKDDSNILKKGCKKDPHQLYLWHSINEGVEYIPDLVSNKEIAGVQLNSLTRIVKKYTRLNGIVYFRIMKNVVRLQKPICNYIDSNGYAKQKFIDFMKKEAGKPYEKNPLELLKATYDSPLPFEQNIEDESSYFCSELVAYTFMQIGLLPNDEQPANEWTPHDFSSESRDSTEENNVFDDDIRAII